MDASQGPYGYDWWRGIDVGGEDGGIDKECGDYDTDYDDVNDGQVQHDGGDGIDAGGGLVVIMMVMMVVLVRVVSLWWLWQ